MNRQRTTPRPKRPSKPNTPAIWLISDGSGSTCAHVVNAALQQFESPNARVIRRGNVRTVREIRSLVRQAARESAIIFYTLIAHELQVALRETADELLVPTVDLLGPVIAGLASLLKTSPQSDPELLYEIERKYADRIDAVDFTLAHDDGRNLATLNDADVVLAGISRVSKSATCFVLACHGIRAANVPLVPDLDPPVELLALPARKVIGLTASLARLRAIRETRVSRSRLGQVDRYVSDREILGELQFASNLFERHGWYSIDVTFKAVEEVAKEVIQQIGERKESRRSTPSRATRRAAD